MPTKAIEFHPEAEAEALASIEWYKARSTAVAARFQQEIEVAIRWIASGPGLWPRIDGQHRRYMMRHFPYYVIFRETEAALQIIAVAHAKRRPGYWKHRNALLQQ